MALVTMHVDKSATKCGKGSSPLRMVPCPGCERTWSSPPSAASRSAIPCRPVPYRVVAVSNPVPLSVTVKRRLSSEQDRPTFARDLDGQGDLARLGLQRRDQALVGQQRRVDAAGK